MTVSIIIPVYNDPSGLRTTVESLINQDNSQYEVIIVDNNSTDKTFKIAKQYENDNANLSVILEDSKQSSYTARNTGVKESNHEIISFIDADMWVDNDYVKNIIGMMEKDCRKYVGYNVELIGDDSFVSRYQKKHSFPVKKDIEEFNFAPTCALVVDKEVFERVGLFDDRLISSGDKEFGQRVHTAGINQHYESNITVYHPTRSTTKELIDKNIRIGRGFQQLQIYHKNKFNRRHVLNTRNFLPINPVSYYKHNHSQINHLRDMTFWYYLENVKKYSRSTGRIIEKLYSS